MRTKTKPNQTKFNSKGTSTNTSTTRVSFGSWQLELKKAREKRCLSLTFWFLDLRFETWDSFRFGFPTYFFPFHYFPLHFISSRLISFHFILSFLLLLHSLWFLFYPFYLYLYEWLDDEPISLSLPLSLFIYLYRIAIRYPCAICTYTYIVV